MVPIQRGIRGRQGGGHLFHTYLVGSILLLTLRNLSLNVGMMQTVDKCGKTGVLVFTFSDMQTNLY